MDLVIQMPSQADLLSAPWGIIRCLFHILHDCSTRPDGHMGAAATPHRDVAGHDAAQSKFWREDGIFSVSSETRVKVMRSFHIHVSVT